MENNPRGIQLGIINQIPVLVDPSWIIIILFFALGLHQVYQELLPQWSWLIGFGVGILYFGSILLHELAHSLVAQQAGIKVNFVVLHFFGGLASLDREPPTAGIEARVAGAGPLMNLLIFGLCLVLIYPIVGENAPQLANPKGIKSLLADGNSLGIAIAIVLYRVSALNLFVALVNLLPGLPLDGGRLFRALMWQISRNRYRGTVAAARSGQILGWFGIIYGILVFLSGSLGGIFFVLIGLMFLTEATQALRLAETQSALCKINAEVTMTRDFRLVDGDTTLRDFADHFLLQEQGKHKPIYFATSNGRDRGWIDPQKLSQIKSDRWHQESVAVITTPLSALTTVKLPTPLKEVITVLENGQLPWVAVLSPVGSVAGVIDRGDVVRALSKTLGWQLPEEMIQRIKQDGVFPPALPLGAISAQLQER